MIASNVPAANRASAGDRFFARLRAFAEKVNPWLIVRIALFCAALLLIWELLVRSEIWSPYLFLRLQRSGKS